MNNNYTKIPKHVIFETYGTLAIKLITLLVAIGGGIAGYLLIDKTSLMQKKAEIEHNQVQLAISISKETDPKVQSDMLAILKAAYSTKNVSEYMRSLIACIEKNIAISLKVEENINALIIKKNEIETEIKKSTNENSRILELKKKKAEIETELALLSEKQPITSEIKLPETYKVDVAIIVGHKESSPGIYNQDYNFSEYAMAKEFSNLLQEELSKRGLTSSIVYRDTYRMLPSHINSINPKIAISIHANGFNSKLSGSEVLYRSDNERSRKLAEMVLDATVSSLNLPNRGIKPKGSEDRSGYLLWYVTSPTIVLETFFIDNNSDLALYQENKTKLAENISKVLKDFLSG